MACLNLIGSLIALLEAMYSLSVSCLEISYLANLFAAQGLQLNRSSHDVISSHYDT